MNKYDVLYTERNGQDVAVCPYCSLYYPLKDEKEIALEIPDTCRRCGSPMDYNKSKVFADREAALASDQNLRNLGRRMRGENPIATEPVSSKES